MEGLKIIVIGAGIGGLTAAIALEQAGYQVRVYDRVQELRPVGAGISLWSNGVKVLNRLGLGEAIAKIGGQMNVMEYRTHQGEVLNHIPLHPLIEQVGQRPYPVARRDLQEMLLTGYGGEVKLGYDCIGVEEDPEGVTALFANGERDRGDLVVAADGIRSVLREYVTGKPLALNYGGYVNWNGLVPTSPELAPADCWVIYVGQHQRASMMPVGGDRFYFFFDVPLPAGTPPEPEQYREQLRGYFQGWAQPVQHLIERLDPQQVARPEIHDISPLDSYVRGRVALLGDAAHSTCPDLGQGGCQAIEDAWVLTNYLKTTNLSVMDALERYNQERRERGNSIIRKARKRAEQIHGKDPEVTRQWYEQLGREAPQAVTNAIAEVILGGPLH
ncbi:FAD-dependent urate hydroxylase HpxO [Spirulina subsalsa]|uniref:FAD-dependent urate hydroxylase HpxO n=1 Tax=Spirulina subsalsa TaxID=54311 RepID=UPI0002DDEB47|nr:FAD-dependent urate hydroxylase HpxO [Spirulina subsalsa]